MSAGCRITFLPEIRPMSEENITPGSSPGQALESRDARVLSLVTEMRDVRLQLTARENRFTAPENRLASVENPFAALENRCGVEEERISGLISLVVRVAERLDGTSIDERVAHPEERMRSPGRAHRGAARVMPRIGTGLLASGGLRA